MGWPFDEASWNGIEGAIYMGAGTSWELVWVLLSAGLCIAALFAGSSHEKKAYKRMEK